MAVTVTVNEKLSLRELKKMKFYLIEVEKYPEEYLALVEKEPKIVLREYKELDDLLKPIIVYAYMVRVHKERFAR